MISSKFKKDTSTIAYKSSLIEVRENKLLVDGDIIQEDIGDINSAYAYAKRYIDALEVIQDNTISEENIASLILKHHNVKITDTLLEAYAELISSDSFTLDPVALEIHESNSLIVGKVKFTLDDGSVVMIDESTKDQLLSLNVDKYKLVEYMKESKENFFAVISTMRE